MSLCTAPPRVRSHPLLHAVLQVWQQKKNIPKDSDNWFAEWYPSANASIKIVCFLTVAYLKSIYCMKEFRVAQAMDKLLVVVCEPMQAIRYRKGEHYWYHVDAGGSTGALVGRALTVLLYLSDGFTGGETSFALAGEPVGMGSKEEVYAALGTGCTTKRGLTITPKAGNALLFYNLQPNSARVDSQSWHASCDVQSGEKLAANLWFHLGLEEFLSTGRKPFSRRPGASIFGAGFLDDDTAFRNYQLG